MLLLPFQKLDLPYALYKFKTALTYIYYADLEVNSF